MRRKNVSDCLGGLTSNYFINRISRFLNKALFAADPFILIFKEGGAVRGLAYSSFPIVRCEMEISIFQLEVSRWKFWAGTQVAKGGRL
jgi:hypothetical protein